MIANAVVRQAVRIPSRVLRSVTCRPRSPRVVVIDVDAVRSRALPPGGLDAQEGEGAGRGRQKHLEKTNASGLTLTLTGGTGTVVRNGGLVAAAVANSGGNVSSGSFPKSTSSFEVTFNVAFTGVPVNSSPSRRLVSYGAIGVNWKSDGQIELLEGTTVIATSSSSTPPLVMSASTNKKYKVTLRRTYRTPVSLSTIEVFVDGVLHLTSTGTNVANTNLGTGNVAFFLGSSGTAYATTLTFDDVRIESVTTPTNDLADGAGIVVEGDGQINAKVADRSITWKKNGGQELGDNSGSYWHIKGGQLMFSRLIDVTKRKAPGTNVLLSSLPTKSTTTPLTEPHLWSMTTRAGAGPYTTAASTGTVALTYASTPAGIPNHDGGYFQTAYGTTYTVSNYSANSISRGTFTGTPGTRVIATGLVKPTTSLALAVGGPATIPPANTQFTAGTVPWDSTNALPNMVELLTFGQTNSAYVSVWVWRSGKILMFTNTAYIETTGIVVGASEFVLGVHLTASGPVLFINGVQPAMTNNGWRTLLNVATTAPVVALSTTATDRGIYLGARRAFPGGSSTPFNVGFKNWRVVDTSVPSNMSDEQIGNLQLYRYADEYDSEPLMVTYGFRIGDDETLQIVKTQGSATTSTLFGNPMPASDDAVAGNSMGGVADGTTNVVFELLNKLA
eukprot:jgi/Mesvir1/14444/Mv05126-RA.1